MRGCFFNHFSLPIITFRSSPTDILMNVLILERFADNILNRFTHPGERGGREPTSLPEEGWTLPREGQTTSSFPKEGWTLFREDWIALFLFFKKGWTSLLPKEGWMTSLFLKKGQASSLPKKAQSELQWLYLSSKRGGKC